MHVDPSSERGGVVMNKFFAFMEGPVGRGARVALGFFLVYLGIGRMGGHAGSAVAMAGLLPILMGMWGPCLARLAINRWRTSHAPTG
jgi:hypothetical protein